MEILAWSWRWLYVEDFYCRLLVSMLILYFDSRDRIAMSAVGLFTKRAVLWSTSIADRSLYALTSIVVLRVS